MQSMQESQIREVEWVQPKRRTRSYELRAGEAVVTSLRWERRSGAVAESAVGTWTLQRSGFIRPRVSIRAPGAETELAVFRGSWDGGGTLEFRDGRIYGWNNTNWQHTAWVWTDRSDRPLLRFKGNRMTIEPGGTSVRELPLLAALSWYLNITSKQESDGAAGAVVATFLVL